LTSKRCFEIIAEIAQYALDHMRTLNATEKMVPAYEARRQFGKLLQAVVANGDKFVVRKNNEEVAVIVPMRVYTQWKQAREDFFALLEKAQKNANCSPEEAEQLAFEAVRAVRAKKSA
jgi:prevent-host-death family protein